MQADRSPLLDQLKDIHAAAEPALWPPAPGWWVLGALLLVLLYLLSRRVVRRISEARRRRRWLAALDDLDRAYASSGNPQEYLAGLNRLFRAVAVRAFPGAACARLQGEEWVAFIASMLPETENRGHLAVLADGPYQPLPVVDFPTLTEQARAWVKRYG